MLGFRHIFKPQNVVYKLKKMNKEQYISKSFERGLTSRCPILDYCSRRAQSIYLLSEYKHENYSGDMITTLINDGVLKKDFKENEIKLCAEVPEIMKGDGYGAFYNMCPEVHLFDAQNSFSYFHNTACTNGSWDKELNPKSKILEEKHYSECLEFSKHFYENKILPNNNIKQTKTTFCFAYLMIDLKTGYHKIGISNNPTYREKTLQSEQPKIETVETRKFANRKIAKEFESELHIKYEHKRIRGEWFDLNPIEINEILELLRN